MKIFFWVAFFVFLALNAHQNALAQTSVMQPFVEVGEDKKDHNPPVDSIIYDVLCNAIHPECCMSIRRTYFESGIKMTELVQKPLFNPPAYVVFIEPKDDRVVVFPKRTATGDDFLIVRYAHRRKGISDPGLKPKAHRAECKARHEQ